MTRRLVVVADDFGLSDGVNEGVVIAHSEGIVTAASLMVRQRAAAEAAGMAGELPMLDVGLHVDLGEWRFVGGEWIPVYEWVDGADADAVAVEIEAQLDLFVSLVGRLPSHLDSHQHVHRREPAASLLAAWARRLGLPLRHHPGVRYEGGFYGQNDEGVSFASLVGTDALLALLARLADGPSELCCHPAVRVDFDGAYREERCTELATLCDPAVAAACRRLGIELVGFRHLVAR